MELKRRSLKIDAFHYDPSMLPIPKSALLGVNKEWIISRQHMFNVDEKTSVDIETNVTSYLVQYLFFLTRYNEIIHKKMVKI
jgi:hypothetical protein